MSDERPLLALVMIVKNESRSIRETLASVKGHVDRWLVLDTGSNDGTQDLVRAAMEGVPGELVEEKFVDFGTTRSRALELAGTQTVFTLMLSGDETLVGGEALRAFCEQHRDHADGAYNVQIHFGATHYDHPRLARTDAGWRYVGVTHEVLMKPKVDPATVRVPDCHIVHDLTHRDAASQRSRWQLDLRLLGDEQKKHPNDTRTAFYYAQTLECLGENKRAFAAYERRVKLGGWPEEVYESLFRMGRVMQAGGRPWPEIQQRYLDAHTHSPHRAEPLFQIAWHYYSEKNWPLTFLFARRASEIAYPTKATLFVDADVYRYKAADLVGTAAYYIGELEAGAAAIRKVLEHMPSDARQLKNLAFYEEKLKKAASLPGARGARVGGEAGAGASPQRGTVSPWLASPSRRTSSATWRVRR